ncbi:hypothetical protein EVAR_63632_1 [Eumeta japonica]|uniref:Uncharacterized protein n=1 Tax=Eumeta variegata TaxID=151549 RepID=A0A4C1ZZ18_EUMVA|nr:hypothetical protein EVAR_63632_1 [Eumeta japonica]
MRDPFSTMCFSVHTPMQMPNPALHLILTFNHKAFFHNIESSVSLSVSFKYSDPPSSDLRKSQKLHLTWRQASSLGRRRHAQQIGQRIKPGYSDCVPCCNITRASSTLSKGARGVVVSEAKWK